MVIHELLVSGKKVHPMTTSCCILDFDGTFHFQGTLHYAEPTDRTVVVADPFSPKVTYYHWNDRII